MADRESDRQVLAVLAAQGANLSKPAHIIHYLYFPSKEAAEAVADELRRAGCRRVVARRAPAASIWKRLFGPREYSCIAEEHGVLTEKRVFAATDRLTALAVKFGGTYDGWESSVEK